MSNSPLPPGAIRSPTTGGILYPFRKGDKSRRHLQVAGGRRKSPEKRLARLLKYAPIAYRYNAKAVLELVGIIIDKQHFRKMLATEFCELAILCDTISQAKLRETIRYDANGKKMRLYNSPQRVAVFEMKARFLELALKLGAQLHGDGRVGAVQAIQIVTGDGKKVEIRPLSAPIDASYSSEPNSEEKTKPGDGNDKDTGSG